MAGSHFGEHCLHQCFFTPNYTVSSGASGGNDPSAQHRMEQKANGKTGVLLAGL